MPKKSMFSEGYAEDMHNAPAGAIKGSTYVGSGEAAFAGDLEPDQADLLPGQTRDTVIAGVRNTLLQRMKKLNADSLAAADAEEKEHKRFTWQQLEPLIDNATIKARSARLAMAEYYVLKSYLGQQDAVAANSYFQELYDADNTVLQKVNRELAASAAEDAGKASPARSGVTGVSPAPQDHSSPESAVRPPEESVATVSTQESEPVSKDLSDAAEVSPAGSEPKPNVEPASPGESGALGTQPGNPASSSLSSGSVSDVSAGASGSASEEAADRVGFAGDGAYQTERTTDVIRGERNTRSQDKAVLDAMRPTIEANLTAKNRPSAVALLLGRYRTKAQDAAQKAAALAREADADFQALPARLLKKSEEWNQKRLSYREKTFRKFYDDYDAQATYYYVVTRGLADRTLPEESAKKIAEYNGVYDDAQLRAVAVEAKDNHYLPTPQFRRVRAKAQSDAGSFNTADTNRPVKFHGGLVMTSFTEGNTTMEEQVASGFDRQRMKLGSDFTGYLARRQGGRREGKLVLHDRFNGGVNTDKTSPALSGDLLHLAVDERGTNDELIHSEKSARIYQARSKTGEKVNGFFLSGTFIPAQYDAEHDQEGSLFSASRTDAAWDEELIRGAIRRSDFFRHVNAETIQYYIGYNPDDDFDSKKRLELFNQAALDSSESLGGGELASYDLPAMVIMVYNVALKIMSGGETDLNAILNTPDLSVPRVEGYDYGNPLDEDDAPLTPTLRPLYKRILENEASARQLALLFLGDDNPVCWGLAETMAKEMGGRYRRVLTRYTRENEGSITKRMSLLTEFSKTREVELSDLTNTILPDWLQQYKEDLALRRDKTISWTNAKQSFFDGTMLSVISGLFSAITSDVGAMGLDSTAMGEVFNSFNKNYAELVSSSATNFNFALIPIPGLTDIFGDHDQAETSLQAVSTVRTFFSVAEGLEKLVDIWEKKIKTEKDPQKKRAYMFEFGKQVLDVISDIIKICNYWMAKATKIPGQSLSIVGILTQLLNIITNSLSLIQNTIMGHAIDAVREDLATAMTDAEKLSSERQQRGELNAIAAAVRAELTGEDEEEMEVIEQPESMREKLGRAASENMQGAFYLTLARANSAKAKSAASYGIKTSVLSIGAKVSSFFKPVGIPFSVLAQATKFVGWLKGKAMDRDTFLLTVGAALGNPRYAYAKNFDDALKREAGIKNRSYLVDLARVFMSIDTHYMATRPQNAEQTALAMTVLTPLVSLTGEGDERFSNQSNIDALKKVKLKQVMEAVGITGDWRGLLRNSLA